MISVWIVFYTRIVYKILFGLSHIVTPDAFELLHKSPFLICLCTTLKCASKHIRSIAYIYLLWYTSLTDLNVQYFPLEVNDKNKLFCIFPKYLRQKS
jgi:hypothetical protein